MTRRRLLWLLLRLLLLVLGRRPLLLLMRVGPESSQPRSEVVQALQAETDGGRISCRIDRTMSLLLQSVECRHPATAAIVVLLLQLLMMAEVRRHGWLAIHNSRAFCRRRRRRLPRLVSAYTRQRTRQLLMLETSATTVRAGVTATWPG